MTTYANATLITIDFNELPDETIVTDQYSIYGATFSGYSYTMEPDNVVAQNGGIKLSWNYVFNFMRIDFSVPVDFVSVDMEALYTNYDLHLNLFGSGSSIAGSSVTADGTQFMTLTGQSSSTYIEYITLFSILNEGEYAGESGAPLIDNLSFNVVDSPPVPEPVSMILLVTGLFGLAVFKKKIRKN